MRDFAAATALLLGLAGSALAHDTWFEPMPAVASEPRLLALGTGNRFPVHELGVDAQYLRAQACRHGTSTPVPMAVVRNDDTALVLRVPQTGGPAQSCWMQLAAFDVTLPADKIDLYISEVHPPPGVLATWMGWHARGLPWQERYTKHARIELPGESAVAQTTLPSGLDMDVLLTTPRQPARVGDALAFQLLRRGKPLANHAVEFRNDRAPIGVWRQSDERGQLRFTPPLPGQWVLRAIELHVSPTAAEQWESDFLTLAFTVAPSK